jgi:hypothetical protein
MHTSRSWMWRAGERRSHNCEVNVLERRYEENEQRRSGETRRAKISAKMVYKAPPKAYKGTMVSRNCSLYQYVIMDSYI